MFRVFLGVIVFISGGVLMGLEIVGSRVLAPYFGNSIFVWGSLISVVLAALSLGYYWGGWLSSRNPSFERLLLLLFIPGVMIALLPFLYPSVNLWIAQSDFGIRLNPLIASVIFFLIPSVFLGAISPYAIRLSATALSTVGSTAGTLYAISTCGSIFGTLFTSFYLIPTIGVRMIVYSLGMTLVLLATLAWLGGQLLKGRVLARVFGTVLACGVFTSTAWGGSRTLLEKESLYHRIRVVEDEEARYLYFDRTLQSAMTKADPSSFRLTYTQYISLGLIFKPDPRELLMVGLGGGSIAKKYQKEFPSLKMDVVEIDAEVIRVAKEYFFFEPGGNLRIHAQDGRLFLLRTRSRYDLILLDAYNADTVPFHLTTREFFELAHQKLTSEGVLVANVIGAVRGSQSKWVRSYVKTLRQVFPQIYLFATRRAQGAGLDISQNVILVATRGKKRMEIHEIVKQAGLLGRDLFPSPAEDIAVAYHAGPIREHDVPVLTDDYAPTDSLLHP